MRLGLLLAACCATTFGLQCNIGNLLVTDEVITSKFIQAKYCGGQCTRSVVKTKENTIVVMGCENNEYAMLVNRHDKSVEDFCDSTKLHSRCVCNDGDFCSNFEAKERFAEIAPLEDAFSGSKCYVGYYVSNSSSFSSVGDTVFCGQGSACAWVGGQVSGFTVIAYFCTPAATCTALLGSVDSCTSVIGDAAVNGRCCSKPDCTTPDFINNTNVIPPTYVTSDKQNVTCFQGAMLNGIVINGGSSSVCQGSCSSFSISTDYAGAEQILDVFSCDPIELCSAINLNNEYSGSNSLIRGCCCNSDNCIDPRTSPPTYPQKMLTCYNGIYIPSTNYNVGAEMICNGQCGRMEVNIAGTAVKYYTCTPYATCYGLGIANDDQCYYSPLEAENKICCCSKTNNCNIESKDIDVIQPNATALPTISYPNLCYGGILLNGVPMVMGSYSRCYGDCAFVTFMTQYCSLRM